jgi:hypothetical protein
LSSAGTLIIFWLWNIPYRKDLQEKQLQEFYAPLYQLYRQAYARFHVWHKNNPESKLDSQPFFDSPSDEEYVVKIFDNHPGHASPIMIRLWADFNAADDKSERNRRRSIFITALIKEYDVFYQDV